MNEELKKLSLRMSSLLILLCLCWQTTVAQSQKRVSGTVAAANGEPIIGAAVKVVGEQSGATTDVNGKFSLDVKPSAVLEVSYLGFETQRVNVGEHTSINIILKENTKTLDEVVVIGYGVARKKDLTGSTVSIKGSEIANIPVTSAAQAITGKLAGVNVVTQSGAPGAPVNITIRGGTSITQSTTPLYIVDGFQMDNALKNIDINDIESIDVMKDASATAIYGARGSNGVVIITTKSAKTGKSQVSYNGYASFERLSEKIDVMSPEEYVRHQYEFLMLRGTPMDQFTKNFGGGNSQDPAFYTGASQYIHDTYSQTQGIDWQDIVFGGSSLLQNHNVSVSGGTNKTGFILSYNNVGQQGILDKHGYGKNNVRAKINHTVNDRIRVDFNSNYNNTKLEGGGSLGGRLRMTLMAPVTGGTRFTNDQMINTDDFYNSILTDVGTYNVYNPILLNNATSSKQLTRQYMGNAGVDINILKNLTFRTAGSYFWQQERSESWEDETTQGAIANHGGRPFGSRNNSEEYSWQITNTLNWKQTFGKHNINALLGQEAYNSQSMYLNNSYDNFNQVNFGLNNLDGTLVYDKSSGLSNYRITSVFGRALYNYNERYLLTASLRGDGVSKFAKGKQWGLLPSASAAWRITEESFMKNNTFFDQLKLRVGYGVTGNCDIDDYMYTTAYGSNVYAVNNTNPVGLAPGSRLGNRELVWEKTKSANLGLDISILKGRVSLTAERYRNVSDNLLLEVAIPKSTGYSTQYQNIASIRNQGFEFVLNTRNIVHKAFTWTTDYNMSFNRSKVLKLYGTDTKRMPPGTFLVEEGSPLGQFFGYKYDGVYTTDDFVQNANGSYTLKDAVARAKAPGGTIKPGDLKYVPTAGEVDANGNPVWTANDRTVIGSALPKFTGGMVNTFAYKGFDLSVFVNFSYGNQVMNANKQSFMGPNMAFTSSFYPMANRFVLIDPATGRETTDLQRLAALNPNQYAKDAVWSLQSRNQNALTETSDYYLEDGSFLRINTVTLGYSLPSMVLKRVGLKTTRMYFTLNNPYVFTNYSGYDPEVSNSSKGFEQGVDSSAYPRSKSFVFGLNLTF
ncbi:TonB-dependent receptor [Pedobacter sp. SYSU D00535]|uniref:SusC/RagA family TonB-linked outer membrane protein n=1 Tax=Pedobacter sp. SYSU D00535 TaxID=2810308 RepID=UPI001A964650|nr:TonB-dependent receptor [Pedobacter sp. SYSU D00535]